MAHFEASPARRGPHLMASSRLREPLLYIMLAGLLSLYCGSASAAETRSVQVTGTAEERVAPDMATLRVAAVADAQDAKAAREAADRTVATALTVLRELRIDDRGIDTSGLRVAPQYRWLEDRRERQLTGYRVTRNLEIRLLDLDVLGEVLTGLSDAGINQMSAPELGLAEPELVYQRVLSAAAANARERAEVMANALNAELGPVHHMSTSDMRTPRPMRREVAMMAADASGMESESYQSGDLSFSVNISVTFELR